MNAIRIMFFIMGTFLLLSAQSFATPINLNIISDGSWRTSDTPTAGWETLTFNDSGWDFARSPYPNPTDPTTLIPDTSAQHIWHDPAGISNGGSGPVEAFFRFTFDLDIQLDSLPLVGQALISVDDDYDLFVNGILIFQNHDGGFADVVDFIDFTSSLRNGSNVIAIHAVDGGWSRPRDRTYERVLFDGLVTTVPAPNILSLLFLGLLGLVGFRSCHTRPSRWTTKPPV
jgi:hypothetical protein